jgi:hypothetical protein
LVDLGSPAIPAGVERSTLNAERRCAAVRRMGMLGGRRPATMADEDKPAAAAADSQQQIQIQIDAQQGTGVYSNLMMISHRKEEFILDFLFLQPQRAMQGQAVATLRSRVITSPEHAKRILRALQENLRRYEETFGIIEEATDMPKVMH